MPASAKAAPPTPTPKAPNVPALTPGKRLAFTLGMLLIPVAFFGGLEGTLRLAGYGQDYPLFQPVNGYPTYLAQNQEVGRRYFALQASVPNSQNDVFLAQKPADEIRLFVQGESSAAGYPFYRGGAFSRMLEQRLQQTFPEKSIEVVNTSMAAINSYTLLDLAGEIIAQRPDAVLIYTGHNEYYGALGAASAESVGRSRWVVRTYLALQSLRTVQWLRATMAQVGAWFARRDHPDRPDTTLMARMVGDQTVPQGSALYEAGLAQWRGNLADLLRTYQAAGIPVYIGTLVSNERDQRPFITAHSEGADVAAWQRQVEAGLAALARNDAATAITALEAATRLDTLAADAFFYLGRAYQAAGRAPEAQAAYFAAREKDALRFRAPVAFNQVIREEAARFGAVVVESEAAVRAASPDGLLGKEHLLEHVHLTPHGYFLIADAFYESLRTQQAFSLDWSAPVSRATAWDERLITPVDSLVGMLRVRQLMAGWPFRPGEAPATTLDNLQATTPLEQIAIDLYQERVQWRSATDALARYYASQGQLRQMLRTRFSIIQEIPLDPEVYVDAANGMLLIAAQTGDATWKREAENYYQAALDRAPNNGPILGQIGALRLERGDLTSALPMLEQAAQLSPQNAQVLYNLAGAYIAAQRFPESRRLLEQVVRLDSTNAGARELLVRLPR